MISLANPSKLKIRVVSKNERVRSRLNAVELWHYSNSIVVVGAVATFEMNKGLLQ